ncbi:hypothetical protein QBC37DRAFT_316681 [Rhypophila decipiens]|uniref:Ribosomal protein S15 n=1 Tax=Rhypophila decipiens TaxID=261697 RepID=A0AAN6Y8F1_9PEZI|nr:hypothetical protein QBC37DRAFT_316681 [Rhypophila decipiens]
MPPRIPGPLGLRSFNLCLRPAATTTSPAASSLLPLTQKAHLSRKEKVRRMKQDPKGWAAAQARKSKNVARQDELRTELAEKWGSPVHGIPTPFVESFDSGGQAAMSSPPLDEFGNPLKEAYPLPTSPHIKNFLLDSAEVESAIKLSAKISTPIIKEDDPIGPDDRTSILEEHAKQHEKAMAVLNRIVDLNNGGAKDRKHANIRRCIETFGRHNTDNTLERPEPPLARGVERQPKPIRAGPDTGSSEVQIAILTAKIRAVAAMLENPANKKDKNNKRSLRSLCHRRQRLLRYMEKKERGSGRWQHMIETLGLTPATWKEQISI